MGPEPGATSVEPPAVSYPVSSSRQRRIVVALLPPVIRNEDLELCRQLELGWRARRKGAVEFGSVALALGVVGVLLVPSVIAIAEQENDWGRECALDPTKENCE